MARSRLLRRSDRPPNNEARLDGSTRRLRKVPEAGPHEDQLEDSSDAFLRTEKNDEAVDFFGVEGDPARLTGVCRSCVLGMREEFTCFRR